MIRIVLPNRTLAITFEHEKIAVPIIDNTFRLSKPSHRWERRTKCEVLECDPVDDKKFIVLSEGYAKCSHKDNFRKDVGRRLALTRALQSKTTGRGFVWRFSKFDRQLIWQGYLNRAIDPIVLAVEKVLRDEVSLEHSTNYPKQ
jgi:hypothetical protein